MISLRPINIKKVSYVNMQVDTGRVRLTDSSKLGPNMQDHNHRHAKRNDMHERSSTLENDSIGDLNVPRIAIRYDARGPGDRRRRADQGA
jgi:hypothetical protein